MTMHELLYKPVFSTTRRKASPAIEFAPGSDIELPIPYILSIGTQTTVIHKRASLELLNMRGHGLREFDLHN